MGRKNTSNPHDADPDVFHKQTNMSVQKAKVLDAKGMPAENGFHTVRIRVYGDNAPYVAPVITPMYGSVWVPEEDTDVAVIFSESDKPWVIGSWYAVDRVDDGDIDLPDYEPGDIRIGNKSGSHVTVHNDGHISAVTPKSQPINIDHQAAVAIMSADQSIPGDDQYYEVDFDDTDDDPENLFDANDNAFVLRAGGQYNVESTVEFQTPGQNNRYTIALYRNGSLVKRVNRQSAINDDLSLSVRTVRGFDANDVIDIRIRQNSGSPHTINSSFEATEFNITRLGI